MSVAAERAPACGGRRGAVGTMTLHQLLGDGPALGLAPAGRRRASVRGAVGRGARWAGRGSRSLGLWESPYVKVSLLGRGAGELSSGGCPASGVGTRGQNRRRASSLCPPGSLPRASPTFHPSVAAVS